MTTPMKPSSLERHAMQSGASLDEYTIKIDPMVADAIDKFVTQLKRKQIYGSFQVSRKTAEIIRLVVSGLRWKTITVLMNEIKRVGKRLTQAQPIEMAIQNVVKRVLSIIREESERQRVSESEHVDRPTLTRSRSLKNFLDEQSVVSFEDMKKPLNLKTDIISGINELIDELDTLYLEVARSASHHVCNGDIILTFGKSSTVSEFLAEAAKDRNFSVLVAEGPMLAGYESAERLASVVNTTVVPDASIFPLMTRVSKVIVGTHIVMANGGILGPAGLHMTALAAKHNNVPFVVCTGVYKLSPLYPHDADAFRDLKNPTRILALDELEEGDVIPDAENPTFDYVPPELVTLFITNEGAHEPAYIHRLLTEYYTES